MKISLIIPAYNESDVIAGTVAALDKYIESLCRDYEIIIVNDGSSDETESIVKGLELKHVRLLGHDKNRGKGYAVRRGMLSAEGDIIFYTDADLAYGAGVIGTALSVFRDTDADIVVGSRKLDSNGYEGYPAIRYASSKCFSLIVRLLSKMSYDTQCGFKGFTKEAAGQIFPYCRVDGFSFDFEALMIAEKKKLKIYEMPVRILNHRQSRVRLLHDSTVMMRDIISVRGRMRREK